MKKIWSKIKSLSLNNLMVIYGEGAHVTESYIPNSSVNDVYINFPDPWPKTRHAKHRLIRPPFIGEIWRILEEKRGLILVTDDPVYSNEMIKIMNRHSGFQSKFPEPHYTTEWLEYGVSYFDQLWRQKGRVIRYHHFDKGPLP